MSGLTQRYISKELVHFVGRGREEDQIFDLLIKIITEGWITHPPHHPKTSGNLSVNTKEAISDNKMYSPQMTCFADIPIEDLSLHMQKYSSFGLSFSKDFIAKSGGFPVHYIPKGATVTRSKDLNSDEFQELIEKHRNENTRSFLDEQIPKIRKLPLSYEYQREVSCKVC